MKFLQMFCLLFCFSLTSISQTLEEPMVQTDIISKSYSQQWELDSIHKKGTFRLVSHKPIYITAGRWSSNPNEKPYSENPEYSATEAQDFNRYEAKLQLSFKTKLLQGLFWGKADVWLAYTQRAYWQIYNKDLSRAFRELNYEPELIFVYPLKIKAFGGYFRSTGVSVNHESNGRDFPLSRSWNRIIFHLGYENENWIVSINPWIRSADTDDENPAITKFIGNGEVNVGYSYNRHEFYTIIRHPFDRIKGGSIQLNYVFPMKGHLRGHFQFFHGYGETLVDYNHSQTTLGIGISFANW
ncbi:phospholipase A [Flavobacterium lacus]|uniref:Phosphatidylcholine 1-acylhydrolase n=1 Tax=Flavobacterium lacus TaxID=1353778 RepID=A0A328WU37_9FLAO|nr:phospholipase A [Flavobacterium lacus]RAR46888.1 phospholipase A1 [Flavobacterium lacus]